LARRIDPFIYEPMERAYNMAKLKGDKHFKKYLRGCGSTFVKRPEVREFVFSRDDHKCVYCGSEDNLQVDHIISIYRVFKDGLDIRDINNLDNLQTLCRSCNSAKAP
jgi:hypothetical protein